MPFKDYQLSHVGNILSFELAFATCFQHLRPMPRKHFMIGCQKCVEETSQAEANATTASSSSSSDAAAATPSAFAGVAKN